MLSRPRRYEGSYDTIAPSAQRGFGMYVIVLALGAVATVTVVSMMTSTSLKTRLQTEQGKILAESKQALIGWAITRGSSTTSDSGLDRPGDLPAPDIASETPSNYDGLFDNGCLNTQQANGLPAISENVNARCLGRLPWQSLGMVVQAPSEQDTEGKIPWYAVSANLARIDSCFPILNPETIKLPYTGFPASCAPNTASNPPYPWLTVRDTRGNVISDRVAFVVMLPGTVVGTQQRTASPNLGGASQYLDSLIVANGCSTPCVPGSYNNADLDNDFIAGETTDTFNDKLLYVTIDELMTAVETQVTNTVASAIKTAATVTYTENPKTALSSGTPRFFWLAPFNPAGTAYQSATVGASRGILPEHLLDTTFSTGFRWSMTSTAPVTRSGTLSAAEVRDQTVPAGRGTCLWGVATGSSVTLNNLLRRVQCTGTIINPETGVTRRTVTLTYTGSTSSTIPVSTNTTAANLVISPATATTTLSRSVTRTTLGSVTLQIIDYNDNSTTWSWNPFNGGSWVYGPEIVGYGTESAGSGYSITTSGISYFPSLPSLTRNWYRTNEWHRFTYIAIASGYQPGGANSCSSGCFTVQLNNNTTLSNAQAVVLNAGSLLDGQNRSPHNTTLSNYFEGNNNSTSTQVFDRRSPLSSTFNDHVTPITP